jgi:hypothetical protein
VVSIARLSILATLAVGIGCAQASAALVQFTQTFVNTSSTAQDFTLTVTTATAFSGEPLFNIRGSLALSLLDVNGNGATVSTVNAAGIPMYLAQIGADSPTIVQTIWNQPWSFSVGAYGNGTPPDQVFQAANVSVNPEVLQPISVIIRLRLSGRDMVTVSGSFEAVPVPAPGAIGLLAAAGISGVGRRRRR